jgi:hypothetical protein
MILSYIFQPTKLLIFIDMLPSFVILHISQSFVFYSIFFQIQNFIPNFWTVYSEAKEKTVLALHKYNTGSCNVFVCLPLVVISFCSYVKKSQEDNLFLTMYNVGKYIIFFVITDGKKDLRCTSKNYFRNKLSRTIYILSVS